jgi:hypothetical protein
MTRSGTNRISERHLGTIRLICALVVALVVISEVQAGATTSVTAASLLATAFRDADAAHWVHETVTVTDNGKIVESMANVIGTSEGEQGTTFANGGRDTLIAFDSQRRLYEKANAKGLVDYQITADTARYANKWMVQTSVDSGYAHNAFGTTLRSDFGQFVLKGDLRLGPIVTKNGELMRAITGSLPDSIASDPGSTTIWVSAAGRILPCILRLNGGAEVSVESWSKWGTGIKLSVPTWAVPYPGAASVTTDSSPEPAVG